MSRNHGFPRTKQMREEKRKQAEARKAEYDKLSVQEKLDRLPEGKCNRQRARYTSILQKEAEKKAVAAEAKKEKK